MTNQLNMAISDIIESSYQESNRGKSKCPIRVSAFGDCTAKLYQMIANPIREDLSGRALRIFELGTQRGQAIAQAITAGIAKDYPDHTVQQEVPIWVPFLMPTGMAAELYERLGRLYGYEDLPVWVENDYLMVRGRADCVVYDNSDGHSIAHIFEIKTKNSYGFDKLDDEGPGLQYLLQLYGYVIGLRNTGTVVESATFIFENKDTCELRTIDLGSIEGIHEMWMSWHARFMQMLYELATTTDYSMATVDPMHVTATALEAGSAGKSTAKLPWQCNYCPIGPQYCVKRSADILQSTIELTDKRRSGSDRPAWMITL